MRKFKLNKQKIILILTVLLAVLLAIAVGRSQPKNIMYESYEKLLEGGMIERDDRRRPDRANDQGRA